jgi:hypothetical protein
LQPANPSSREDFSGRRRRASALPFVSSEQHPQARNFGGLRKKVWRAASRGRWPIRSRFSRDAWPNRNEHRTCPG